MTTLPGGAPTERVALLVAIKAKGIADHPLLRAFETVPRAAFVPAHLVGRAHRDEPLPIPHGQVTTQPSLVGRMLQALQLRGSEHVLEIGTGYGYQTALLARLARFVWSIERWADMAEAARTALASQGIGNAEVIVGDGTLGMPERAPFDAILVAAAYQAVPPPLLDQLAVGGRLVQPIGQGDVDEVTLIEKGAGGRLRRHAVCGARFVRLYGQHAFPASPE